MADAATINRAIARCRKEGWIVTSHTGWTQYAPEVRRFRVRPRGTLPGHSDTRTFTGPELAAFAGLVDYIDDRTVDWPDAPAPADPLDVVDWDTPAPHHGGFFACMALLGLCLAVLTVIGAVEVLADVTTLYRSLHP